MSNNYTLTPSPWCQFFDNSGNPLAAGQLYVDQAGLSGTAATVYQDASGSTTWSYPIILDAYGRAAIFLTPGQSYLFRLYTSVASGGSLVRTQDNIAATPVQPTTVDVTGTAGETLTAGLGCYLSDGSGSKTAGRWYLWDSANAYSSVTPEVGMVPTTIASGASGLIRQSGAVTGLSSRTAGAIQYIGTAGALTETEPTNNRRVGQADSTSSIVLDGNPPVLLPVASQAANDFVYMATANRAGRVAFSAAGVPAFDGTNWGRVAPGASGNVLQSDGTKWASASANTPLVPVASTGFETAARFTETFGAGGGSSAFNTTGVAMTTGGVANGKCRETWQVMGTATQNDLETLASTSLVMMISFLLGGTVGTDGQVFLGVSRGSVVGDAALTLTQAHIGFKITWASSGTVSLYATQADTAETASTALTTLVVGDQVALMWKWLPGTSVSYYYKKNTSAWSSATTLTTHFPTGTNGVGVGEFGVNNGGAASTSTVTVTSATISTQIGI